MNWHFFVLLWTNHNKNPRKKNYKLCTALNRVEKQFLKERNIKSIRKDLWLYSSILKKNIYIHTGIRKKNTVLVRGVLTTVRSRLGHEVMAGLQCSVSSASWQTIRNFRNILNYDTRLTMVTYCSIGHTWVTQYWRFTIWLDLEELTLVMLAAL